MQQGWADVNVIGHDAVLLDGLGRLPPHYRTVNVTDLNLGCGLDSNQLSESRLWLSHAAEEGKRDYVGFFSYRYDKKFPWLDSRLRTVEMHCFPRPKYVWCPWDSTPNWLDQSQGACRGLGDLCKEMCQRFHLDPSRSGPFCSSFIMHRSLMPPFLDKFCEVFEYYHGKYGFDLPFQECDEGRKAGFFYERVTLAIIANFDVEVRQIG